MSPGSPPKCAFVCRPDATGSDENPGILRYVGAPQMLWRNETHSSLALLRSSARPPSLQQVCNVVAMYLFNVHEVHQVPALYLHRLLHREKPHPVLQTLSLVHEISGCTGRPVSRHNNWIRHTLHKCCSNCMQLDHQEHCWDTGAAAV